MEMIASASRVDYEGAERRGGRRRAKGVERGEKQTMSHSPRAVGSSPLSRRVQGN
jgi:hypothetical protein